MRARVATLERDVSGLEAIVMNLDRKRQDLEKLDHQVVKLFDDVLTNTGDLSSPMVLLKMSL